MKVTKIKLSELKRPEKNVRMHTDKQLNEFRRSVEKFGQIRPIVVDENKVMLAGNGLYETLLSLGYETADCYVVSGLSENDKKKLMLADNRIFNLGVDDMAAFDEILAELGDDLDVPGYDIDLLQTLVANSDDVDDMMSEYGKIDDERKEEINEAQQTYEANNVHTGESTLPMSVPAVATQSSSLTSEADNDETQEIRRYVTCPKCGEKIWL